jgi:hypothetical protein
VTLKVDPGPGRWLVSGGMLSSGTGSTVTFIARDTPGNAAVSVEVNGLRTGIQFQVIAPSQVHHRAIGQMHKANSQPNAGFCAEVYIGPADVSFNRISWIELEVAANDVGYWAAMTDKGHHPSGPIPATNRVASGLGTFAHFDNIFSGHPGVTTPPFAGSRTWNIQWQYQVGSGSPHNFLVVTQSIVTDAAGVTTATKAGASSSAFALTDPAASC